MFGKRKIEISLLGFGLTSRPTAEAGLARLAPPPAPARALAPAHAALRPRPPRGRSSPPPAYGWRAVGSTGRATRLEAAPASPSPVALAFSFSRPRASSSRSRSPPPRAHRRSARELAAVPAQRPHHFSIHLATGSATPSSSPNGVRYLSLADGEAQSLLSRPHHRRRPPSSSSASGALAPSFSSCFARLCSQPFHGSHACSGIRLRAGGRPLADGDHRSASATSGPRRPWPRSASASSPLQWLGHRLGPSRQAGPPPPFCFPRDAQPIPAAGQCCRVGRPVRRFQISFLNSYYYLENKML
jgi:hypothetical protein